MNRLGEDPNPREDPSSKFQTASSPQPSPPGEEREKIRSVHGSNAHFSNVEALMNRRTNMPLPMNPRRDVAPMELG